MSYDDGSSPVEDDVVLVHAHGADGDGSSPVGSGNMKPNPYVYYVHEGRTVVIR